MSLDIDDLPVVETLGKLGRRAPADSPVSDAYRMYRPIDETRFGSLGLSLGFQVARLLQERVFPSGTQLAELYDAAAGPSYTMFLDCGGYDYNATCDEACFGFAPHHMDPFYCATCDEQAADPVNNPSYNWHFVGSRGSIQYMDREPDVCNGRDAWKWKVGACNDCAESAVFRCHDGYKKYPGRSYWDATICQGLVSCDGRLTPC
jgi:hypothetical protein